MRGSNATHRAYDEDPSQHDKDGTQFFRLIHLICMNHIQPPKQQYQPPKQQYQPPIQQYQPPIQQYQHFDPLRRVNSQRELHNYALRHNRSLRYEDTESSTISDHDWSSIAFSKHTTSFYIPSLSDSSLKLLVNDIEYGRGMGRTRSAAREAAAHQALITAGDLQYD
jgi:hypothetical protein